MKRRKPRRKSAQLLRKAIEHLRSEDLGIEFAYQLRDRWRKEQRS